MSQTTASRLKRSSQRFICMKALQLLAGFVLSLWTLVRLSQGLIMLREAVLLIIVMALISVGLILKN